MTASEAGIMDDLGDIVEAAVTYQTPDSYMVGTVLIAAVMGFILATVYALDKYGDQLEKKGLTKAEYPFGIDYVVMIILPTAIAAFAGYFGSGIFLGLVDQQDAPGMVYYVVAFCIGILVGRYGWNFLRKLPDIVRKSKGKTASDVASDLDAGETPKQ